MEEEDEEEDEKEMIVMKENVKREKGFTQSAESFLVTV